MTNQYYNDIPKGFRIPSQIRLDAKTSVQNEESLKDLGVNNNLAFTYYEGLEIYCKDEKTKYVWREVVGNEVGLMTTNFTYPIYSPIDGVDYSGKSFNFFSTIISVTGAETKITAGTNITKTGTGTVSDPYVINANVPSAILPPLEITNEGNGDGIIIRGRVAENYGNIGLNAVDLSYSSGLSTTVGATGVYSFTSGRNNTASEHSATSMGGGNISSGQGSFTVGISNVASATNAMAIGYGNDSIKEDSISIGRQNLSSGYNSVTLGTGNFAKSLGEISIGLNGTDYIAEGSLGWMANDRIFNIGNGTSIYTSSNAFTILKNGLATLPSVTNALITSEPTGKAVVTKEYLTSVLPINPDGSETKINISSGLVITGNGTSTSPYLISVENLQKSISGSTYTITDTDDNYTIFIQNDITPMTITVPDNLIAKIGVGFIQKGTADVTFTTSGVATLVNPAGFKLKGKDYQVFVEKVLNTTEYNLLGNTKA